LSDLKEMNQTTPRFVTQKFNRYQYIHGRPQKFFQDGVNVEILLILYRLLTMQRKWMFAKRFPLSPPLVCAGWTSILNLFLKWFLHFCCQICSFS